MISKVLELAIMQLQEASNPNAPPTAEQQAAAAVNATAANATAANATADAAAAQAIADAKAAA
jgi:hypothetical protein